MKHCYKLHRLHVVRRSHAVPRSFAYLDRNYHIAGRNGFRDHTPLTYFRRRGF